MFINGKGLFSKGAQRVHRTRNQHTEKCSASLIAREMQTKTIVRQCVTLLRMALARKQKVVSVDKVMAKLEPLSTVSGSVRWCSHCGKEYGSFSKHQ